MLASRTGDHSLSRDERGEIHSRYSVEGQAECRPPRRHAWVRDQAVVKEVKDAVRAQSTNNQPQVLFEADNQLRRNAAIAIDSVAKACTDWPMIANRA